MGLWITITYVQSLTNQEVQWVTGWALEADNLEGVVIVLAILYTYNSNHFVGFAPSANANTMASSHLVNTSKTARSAVELADRPKFQKYQNLGFDFFIPFGVEILGPWGLSALSFPSK